MLFSFCTVLREQFDGCSAGSVRKMVPRPTSAERKRKRDGLHENVCCVTWSYNAVAPFLQGPRVPQGPASFPRRPCVPRCATHGTANTFEYVDACMVDAVSAIQTSCGFLQSTDPVPELCWAPDCSATATPPSMRSVIAYSQRTVCVSSISRCVPYADDVVLPSIRTKLHSLESRVPKLHSEFCSCLFQLSRS